MPPTGALVTADELLHMLDDDLRHELVAGRLTSMSPPGFLHGVCANRLAWELTGFVKARGLGVVVQDTGFVLARDPDTVRAPDVAFVASERVGRGTLSEKYWEGAPDLAVEVLSPGERLRDIDAKVWQYLACGSRAVWVVRPRKRTVSLHHAGRDVRVLVEPDVLEDSTILRGFTLPLPELFRDLPATRARTRRR